MRRLGALLVALCAASQLHAAVKVNVVAYTVRRHGVDPAKVRQQAVVAGPTWIRVDLPASPGDVVTHDTILWDHRSPMIALNSQLATWYELEDAAPLAPSSGYLHPSLPNGTARNVRWILEDLGGAANGDHQYAGYLSYEVHETIEGEPVKVFCTADFTLTTTARLDRTKWMGNVFPQTGYEEVDRKLAAAGASIAGFPMRIALTATRRYEGGAAMRESSSVEVTGIHDSTVDAAVFVRPANYRLQKPVIGVPGSSLPPHSEGVRDAVDVVEP